MERAMPLKKFIASSFPEDGAHYGFSRGRGRASWGKHQGWSGGSRNKGKAWAGALIVIPVGKAS